MADYLIIGNGVAGTTAAENIRKLDKTGKITVVTEESTPFYYRMRLPEFMSYQILAQNEQYYTGHPVDIAYLWAYVFFVFGAYHHVKIFKGRSQENRFNSQENMR